MEDPELNRSIEESRELHTRWSQFHDFCLMAMTGEKITTQAEMKFLELKSRIAMLHDGFMTMLKHDVKTGQNIMQIVADSILLRRVAGYTDAEKQKFEFDWNECFLLLTEHIGTLEDEQQRLAGISQAAHRAAQRKDRLMTQLNFFIHSMYLKIILGVFVLFMLVWGIPAFGIYDYRNFGEMSWSLPLYSKFCNAVWRPFFNKEIEFKQIQYVPMNADIDNNLPKSIQIVSPGELTLDNLKNSAVFEIGASPNDAKQLEGLFGQQTDFLSERYRAEGVDARFFYIMFQTSDAARQFAELIQKGFNANPDKDKIANKATMFRVANFVMIGISDHLHGRQHIIDKFKLSKPVDLLN
ncbi:MAG: hypothetical protein M1457_08330 [bacterium]|nr:hypothetical protein [bacterium]